MRAEDLFHTGIVVDDLDASLVQLSDLFGHEWGQEVDVDQTVEMADGSEITVRFRFYYSITTPRLEMIQANPGTIWTPAEGSGIHHLGFWSDDLARDGKDLEAAGYAREVAGDVFAYHRSPAGPRIEIIDRSIEPLLSGLWAPTEDD